MSKSFVGLFLLILAWSMPVCGQTQVDTLPPDEVIAANRRLYDLLKNPDFITLRLTYGYVYEKPVDNPKPYSVGDSMYFELLVSQSLLETITVEYTRWAQYEYRPELRRDGEILTYSKRAQMSVEKAEDSPDRSSFQVKLVPTREHRWSTVRLDDWYEPLEPGHYELSVRKRFVWDGDWLQSNSLTFEVLPRNSPPPKRQ